ncbi:MAG: type II toxin-antitoxin system PemK/MazF family toxin [Planctomycetia bacterium]|nr:type II toxin-antitoxin system PemK/MazF family toxin [Planctomycetia bacterium]
MAIQRGDIYFVDLNPVKGREQAGSRPVVVLTIDAINKQPLVVVVVVGTKGENVSRDYPTNVRLPATDTGLPTETVFMGFQMRSLDPERFSKRRAGRVTSEALERIENAVRYCLGL